MAASSLAWTASNLLSATRSGGMMKRCLCWWKCFTCTFTNGQIIWRLALHDESQRIFQVYHISRTSTFCGAPANFLMFPSFSLCFSVRSYLRGLWVLEAPPWLADCRACSWAPQHGLALRPPVSSWRNGQPPQRQQSSHRQGMAGWEKRGRSVGDVWKMCGSWILHLEFRAFFIWCVWSFICCASRASTWISTSSTSQPQSGLQRTRQAAALHWIPWR